MQNYEPDVSQLLALYQQLEDDIIADMVRRMMRMGFVSESTAYQAQVLQTAGLLYDDIIAMIAQRTDASVEQVK
ncbi:phage minor capsid protein, partial [Ruminococcus sp.]|uniref:phage minor capsid protein n=1 Tax=Ruminococcus sp. TaxID=41978 RepID=UPI003439853D